MSEEVVEMREPPFEFKNMFLAAVKAAGGSIAIETSDYLNPPEVYQLSDGSDGKYVFEVRESE